MSTQEVLSAIREALPQWLKEDPALRQILREMLEETLRPWEEIRAEIRAFREEVEGRLSAQEQALLQLTQTVQELVRITQEHSAAIRRLTEQGEEHSAVIRVLVERTEEHSRRLEEHSAAIRALTERMEEHSRIIQRMLETLERHSQEIERMLGVLDRHSREIQRLSATIGALGARWGLSSEAAFRDGMAALLREAGWRVERFLAMDSEGYVFGRPDQVEIDVVIRDGEAILIEIRSSVSRGDVAIFQRKVEFYARHTGIPVARRILISPMVDPRAQDLAQRMGMEVYTYPEDVPFGSAPHGARSF
ncbi:PD-(D/E)XK nuclease family protein [Thermoflexus sp.]|uniref:PD-(D/E)XK nuclease family protein n=1 Tax=Thermoflexus sp. TaxID=1969742 RepID=UPI0035E43935